MPYFANMSFIQGLLAGLAMVIFIGPVLFSLLQAALKYGFKGGFTVALGIIISDAVAVVICFHGAIPFFNDEYNQYWIALIGGILIIAMGIKYLWKPSYYNSAEIKLGARDFSSLFTKGFLVNFINPFVFLVWIGLIGYAQKEHPENVKLYLVGALIGIFLTDTLKSFFADSLRPLLAHDKLKRIYMILGILLLFFGIRLIVYATNLIQ